MIRTCQLLTYLLWKSSAPTQLLSALEGELCNLNSIHASYQPLVQAATQLLSKECSFNGIPVTSKCMRRSLLPFSGVALSWLTGTATTKDVTTIKTWKNQLINTQQNQQETLVHIISILNITRCATHINRQHVNILMNRMEKMHQDVRTLYNIIHSLYSNVSYQQIILHTLSILANLQGSLYYMREVALHTMTILMQQLQEYSHHMCYLSKI